MGIKDLKRTSKLDVEDLLAELEGDERYDVLHEALVTRKRNGTSRFFKVSAAEIVRACEDDGFLLDINQIGEWRRANVD